MKDKNKVIYLEKHKSNYGVTMNVVGIKILNLKMNLKI